MTEQRLVMEWGSGAMGGKRAARGWREEEGWAGEGEGSVDGDFGGGRGTQGWQSNGDEGGWGSRDG